MWKKFTRGSGGDSQLENQLATPHAQPSRSLGLPPTPTGRQGSQQILRQEQDVGAVFQLCDRISAFVYGESELPGREKCPVERCARPMGIPVRLTCSDEAISVAIA